MSYEQTEEDISKMTAREPDMAYGRRYTAADYLEWTMEYMVELIGGRVFDMSAAPLDPHQKVSGDLQRELSTYFKKKKCAVRDAPYNVYFPESGQHWKEAENVVQPDICVICDRSKIIRRGCIGAPDFIVEILSPSTASKDLTHKKNLYEKHGVKEYWVVSIEERTLIRYVLDYEKYREEIIKNQQFVSPELFPDLELDFVEIFSDLIESE